MEAASTVHTPESVTPCLRAKSKDGSKQTHAETANHITRLRIALKQTIELLVAEHDPDGVIAARRIPQLAASLAADLDRTIVKYIKGQKEHGMDVTLRDLLDEIGQEIMDLKIYFLAIKDKWTVELNDYDETNSDHYIPEDLD